MTDVTITPSRHMLSELLRAHGVTLRIAWLLKRYLNVFEDAVEW
jgi:hypothetical protein